MKASFITVHSGLSNKNIRVTFSDDIGAFLDTLLEEWGTVFTYNWKLCVCAIFGLIMTIVMPILGVVWCIMHKRGKSVHYTQISHN